MAGNTCRIYTVRKPIKITSTRDDVWTYTPFWPPARHQHNFREVLGSNLGQETGCRKFFSRFSSVPSEKFLTNSTLEYVTTAFFYSHHTLKTTHMTHIAYILV
jgi:hypothetical protein